VQQLIARSGAPPPSLRSVDFVTIEGEGGTSRLALGKNHSGLSGGRPWVLGAGEIELGRDGRIISINRASGHYRPSAGNPERVRQFLRDHGILGPRAVDAISEIPVR
jgi:hypothetical protein